MMRQISEEEPRKPLTDGQKREIRALEDMPDSEIDLSDIPEITEFPSARSELAARRRVPVNDLVVETPQKALEVAETVR